MAVNTELSAPMSTQVFGVMPQPVLVLGAENQVLDANSAAEAFFEMSLNSLRRRNLKDIVGFASPLFSLVEHARQHNASINEYRVDMANPRGGGERSADIHVAPLRGPGTILVMLQERTIADKMDRQLTHRGAARSVSALAAMLAHEIKNPLSGIRGAAQLLESALSDEDRALTRLICDETDRIVKLVDRLETFSDERMLERESLNIHAVLDHVKRLAQAGFAQHIRFVEIYDPSLPPVHGNRDQLVQVLLNLVKNAAEAIGEDSVNGEIQLTTAFRPGVRLRTAGSPVPVSLPLEIGVRDNGSGVAPDVLPVLFDPFVTTKTSGTGLGLALVAKMIGDHGGIIECESQPRRTLFRILLPASVDNEISNEAKPKE